MLSLSTRTGLRVLDDLEVAIGVFVHDVYATRARHYATSRDFWIFEIAEKLSPTNPVLIDLPSLGHFSRQCQ